MDDGGMIPAAHRLADGNEGNVHDIAHEERADLAGLYEFFFLALAQKVFARNFIKSADAGNDLILEK